MKPQLANDLRFTNLSNLSTEAGSRFPDLAAYDLGSRLSDKETW